MGEGDQTKKVDQMAKKDKQMAELAVQQRHMLNRDMGQQTVDSRLAVDEVEAEVCNVTSHVVEMGLEKLCHCMLSS